MVVLFCQKIAVSCNCQEIQIIFIKSLVYEARGLRNSITTYNLDVPARPDQNLPHSDLSSPPQVECIKLRFKRHLQFFDLIFFHNLLNYKCKA